MKIEINAIGFSLTDALEQYVERRINYAFSANASHLKYVIVRLSDINGPKGGPDKCCQIQSVLPGHPDIMVEDTAVDYFISINRAASRANRSVSRQLKKRQSKQSAHHLNKMQTAEAWSQQVENPISIGGN